MLATFYVFKKGSLMNSVTKEECVQIAYGCIKHIFSDHIRVNGLLTSESLETSEIP